MLYGHYLQKKGQHISQFCVAVSKLQKDHNEFYKELVRRWDVLESKRTIKVGEDEKEAKRRKALGYGWDGGDETASMASGAASHPSTAQSSRAPESAKLLPYMFLPAADKARLRDECQTAWDTAFVMCGIRFQTADSPYLRVAMEKTRACPDFKLACSKTMRTSRLAPHSSE